LGFLRFFKVRLAKIPYLRFPGKFPGKTGIFSGKTGIFPGKTGIFGFSREIFRENERGFYIQILNGEMSDLISLN
jgi:hypothetical protein